jgi:hypothetical protein
MQTMKTKVFQKFRHTKRVILFSKVMEENISPTKSGQRQ